MSIGTSFGKVLMKLSLVFAAILNLSLAYAEETGKRPDIYDLVDVEIKIKTAYDPISSDPDLSFTNAKVNLHLSDETIESVLESLGKDKNAADFKSDWVADISVRTSVVPYLLRDSTEEELNLRLDEILDSKKLGALQQVTNGVNQALNANPNFPMLPAAQQEAIRNASIAKIYGPIEQQIEGIRAAKKIDISKRLDSIQQETSIQEVAVAITNGVLFLKIGKFQIVNGPSQSSAGTTLLEDVRAVNMMTARGTGAASTGAIQLTWMRNIGNGRELTIDAVLFHDKLPFVSGRQYLAGVVNLEEKEFERHEKVTDIDSQLLRAIINGERSEFYLTLSNHNGDGALQLGGYYKITNNILVDVNYVHGRDILEDGMSLFLVGDITRKLSVYAGVERLRGSYNPLISTKDDKKVDTRELVMGLRYRIWDREILGQKVEWTAYGEVYDLKGANGSLARSASGTSWRAGTQVQVKFGRRTKK